VGETEEHSALPIRAMDKLIKEEEKKRKDSGTPSLFNTQSKMSKKAAATRRKNKLSKPDKALGVLIGQCETVKTTCGDIVITMSGLKAMDPEYVAGLGKDLTEARTIIDETVQTLQDMTDPLDKAAEAIKEAKEK